MFKALSLLTEDDGTGLPPWSRALSVCGGGGRITGGCQMLQTHNHTLTLYYTGFMKAMDVDSLDLP